MPRLSIQHRLRRPRHAFLGFYHGFRWFGGIGIPFPSLVFQPDPFNGYGPCIGIELGQGTIAAHPATVNLLGDGELAGFVVEFDHDVLAEIPERSFRTGSRAEAGHFVGPFCKLKVVRHTPLQHDRIIPG